MATAEKTQTSHSKHLESTIDSIEEHVKKETVTGVSVSISTWIKTLGEYKELKGIASDLEKLKEAISEKDGEAIVKLMTKLGEDTTKAAESAENGESQKIKMLGKALTTAAKAISKIA
ncbi:MAG: hypothetical protein H7X88_12850 [Gloeobacteraceae cyanobacterium ES-bin-316]|nr:hypothetical protein [Ferruginibacter sp.]